MNIYKNLHSIDKTAYFLKICEELGELQTAVLHYRDRKCEYLDVVKEIADVTFQLEKIVEWLANFDEAEVANIYVDVNETHEKVKNILEKKYKSKIRE